MDLDPAAVEAIKVGQHALRKARYDMKAPRVAEAMAFEAVAGFVVRATADAIADQFEAGRVVLQNAAEIYRHLVMDTPADQELHQRVVATLDDAARSFGSRVLAAETEGQQQ